MCASDEGGFDLDRFTTNSIMQFNYSHHNDGWGYMIGSTQVNSKSFSENNVVRFNISQNDCRNSSWGSMLFENWSASNVYVYNNTFYMSNNPLRGSPAPAIGFIIDQNAQPRLAPVIRIYNNIFFTDSGKVPVINVANDFPTSNLHFQANDYYSQGAVVTIMWQGSPISLDQFRNMGQDSIRESDNPRLGFVPNSAAPTIQNTDTMASDLMPSFELTNPNTPRVIQTGGVDLARVIGPLTSSNNWWAPDFFWIGALGTRGHDLWAVSVPKPIGAGLYSMGASQYKP